ncbi:VanZ family protein [Priestia megaterium]|uniref:VanZ family protein n=1 Tax=Priestia megaterium TaxID=1404 RepID=UPI0024531ED1|nr:VanZ family protein [Priestia megaterium]MDH3188376.1 VanZ family protein [Priestia megaterium]
MLNQKIIDFLLLGSFLFMACFTLVPEPSLGIGIEKGKINIIPLHTIKNSLFHQTFLNFTINNLGNIVLFIPFGLFVSFKLKNLNKVWRVIFIGMIISIVIECIQLFIPNRWTDIDDVLLNTLGTGVGYIIFKIINKFYKKINAHNQEGSF